MRQEKCSHGKSPSKLHAAGFVWGVPGGDTVLLGDEKLDVWETTLCEVSGKDTFRPGVVKHEDSGNVEGDMQGLKASRRVLKLNNE